MDNWKVQNTSWDFHLYGIDFHIVNNHIHNSQLYKLRRQNI